MFNRTRASYLIQKGVFTTLFFSFLITSHMPAQSCALPECHKNEESSQRLQVARLLTIATIVVAGAGVAYAVACSKCNGRHSSHGSSSYPYGSSSRSVPINNSSYNSSGDGSSYSYSGDYSNEGSSYSVFDNNIVSNFSGGGSSSISEIRAQKIPSHTRKYAAKNKEKQALSGVFCRSLSLPLAATGGCSVFVQSPDGTREIIGHISLSSNRDTSLSFGPFTKKGTYTFGIVVDEETTLSTQSKIGSIEIAVDGATAQKGDFSLPAHPSIHYEPQPLYFHFE